MQIVSEKIYDVVPGERHLGKQIETVVEVSREEYIEALSEAFLEGAEHKDDTFIVSDGDWEQEYTLGCDLTESEIDSIIRDMNFNLLDDDYGSGKDYDLLYDLLDEYIDEDWTDEFICVEMRGY